jgi:hypothetical protein
MMTVSRFVLCVVLALALAASVSADCIAGPHKGNGFASVSIHDSYTLTGVADLNFDDQYGVMLNLTMTPQCKSGGTQV